MDRPGPGGFVGIPDGLAASLIASVPGGIAADLTSTEFVPQETTDGMDWRAAPESPEGSRAYRTESGWFAGRLGRPDDPGEWWVRVGQTWVSLTGLGIGRSAAWCVYWPTSVGTTTIFTAAMDERCAQTLFQYRRRPTEMWILDLGLTD